jgi:hypothetical protein
LVDSKRAALDLKTLESLIELYCKAEHGSRLSGLCMDCSDLLRYSLDRYDACPYKKNGRLCSICEVHCYKGEYRGKIIEVMRFSGPRLVFYHPFLALRYMFLIIRNKVSGNS